LLTEYACCPRCLGDLIEEGRPGNRSFVCLQCGDSGEFVPAEEYIARKLEHPAATRKASAAPTLATA
jgi:hypothetical protein